jgi:hypothetical protein
MSLAVLSAARHFTGRRVHARLRARGAARLRRGGGRRPAPAGTYLHEPVLRGRYPAIDPPCPPSPALTIARLRPAPAALCFTAPGPGVDAARIATFRSSLCPCGIGYARGRRRLEHLERAWPRLHRLRPPRALDGLSARLTKPAFLLRATRRPYRGVGPAPQRLAAESAIFREGPRSRNPTQLPSEYRGREGAVRMMVDVIVAAGRYLSYLIRRGMTML